MTRAIPLCAALGVALALAAGAGERIAARIGGAVVTLAEVDAASGGKCEALLARLEQRASAALEALIDERLVSLAEGKLPAPVPEPVTEAEIDRFRAERAADFEGPQAPTGSARLPSVQREAIRHYLEAQARERARSRALSALRGRHRIQRFLPPAPELAGPLAADRVVARVDDTPIRAEALESRAALPLYRLRGELARERLRRSEALVAERLLAREAARRGTSVEAMIEAEVEPPDEAEWNAFVASERAAGRPVPERERARPLLEFRALHAARASLVSRLREQAEVETTIVLPEPPRLPVHAGGAPSLGAEGGARLVAYTNYRCRACRLAHAEIDRLLAASGDVRVVFRDWIPQYDPGAREAAALARCAAEQGRFAAMRAALLAVDPPAFGLGWPRSGEDGIVARAGVDPGRLERCLAGDVERAVDRDGAQARALGFERAPAFVAEGLPLSGVQSAEGLAGALRRGLGAADAGR